MFAGPNGSGKSTLKARIAREFHDGFFGVYVNPDEIEAEARRSGRLLPGDFGISCAASELLDYFARSPFLRSAGLTSLLGGIRATRDAVEFQGVGMNSYFASVASDFIRRRLISQGSTFTFETVMSSRDKVELLAEARTAGYRTYLYFVATETPAINVSRVGQRVSEGGHGVPEEKIVERYARSLDNLREAIRHADRAFVFDNTNAGHQWIAEVCDGILELRTDLVPRWFERALLDKLPRRLDA